VFRLLAQTLIVATTLLAVIVGVAWLRSKCAIDVYTRPRWEAYSASEEMRLFISTSNKALDIPMSQLGWHSYRDDDWAQRSAANYLTYAISSERFSLSGFEIRQNDTAGLRVVVIRYWLPVVLLSIPLLTFCGVRMVRFLRHRSRRIAGLCPTCHYDLRAHKPGDRCPECGTPIRDALTNSEAAE
jgi:hypothetical protein